MNNRRLATLAILALCAAAPAAVITQWNFNTLDGNFSTGTLNPSTGSGSIANIGETSSFFGFAGGSSDPEGPNDDSAWGIGNLPQQGTGSGTAGMEGLVSTVGFQNIRLSFDIKTQFSSSKYYQVQYRKAANGAWIGGPTFGVAVEDVWELQNTFNLSSLDSGVDDNPNFGFRVVAVFKPGTDFYAGMNDGPGSYGRFGYLTDMVTVQGDVVPEPGTLAALAAPTLALVARRRKK